MFVMMAITTTLLFFRIKKKTDKVLTVNKVFKIKSLIKVKKPTAQT